MALYGSTTYGGALYSSTYTRTEVKKVIFYDGYGMQNQGMRAFIENWGGPPSTSPNFREVSGSYAKFVGNRLNPNEFTMVVEFDQLAIGASISELRNEILSLIFDRTDLDSEHRIDVIMDDGVTNCYRMVVPIELSEIHNTYMKIRFRSSRGEWTNVRIQQIIENVVSTNTTIVPQELRDRTDHPVPPTASSWPIYRVRWSTQRTTCETAVGWKYEQIWRITNNETSAMRNECIRLSLGDTRSWFADGKTRSDGRDIRIWIDGRERRRNLVNWATRLTSIWLTIDEVPAGGYKDVSMVYGNLCAGGAPILREGSDLPAFNIAGDNSTIHPIRVTDPSSVNTLNIDTNPWYTNMWAGGVITVWDTDGTSQARVIESNDGNTITVGSSWSANPTSTWSYVIDGSRNERHAYHVRQSNRGAWIHGSSTYNNRGGWSINKGANRPSVVRFADQVPGAWSRVRVLDNNDRVEQPRYSWIDTGSGDFDAFSIFDTTRGQGQARKKVEDGQYDGVMLSSVHGFTKLVTDFIFYNPIRTSTTPTKGSCNFKIVTMDEGGEDWSDLYVNGTANEDNSIRSTMTFDLTAENPRHVGYCLVGRDQEGSDVEITSKLRKDKIARARWGSVLYVEQSTDNWPITKIQSENEKYQLVASLRLNGSSAYDDDIEETQMAHGVLQFGGAGHHFMLDHDEQVVYDTRTGMTEIRDPDDNLMRRVPYAAVAYAYERGSDDKLHRRIRRDAMVLRPPREYASNRTFNGDIVGWELGFTALSATASLVYSPTQNAADIRIISNVTSDAVGQTLALAYNPSSMFSVVPGRTYTITGRIKTTNVTIFPGLTLRLWGGLPGIPPRNHNFPLAAVETLNADQWYIRQTAMKIPSWARYAWVGISAVQASPTPQTGHVYFDYVTTTDAIIVSEKRMGDLEVTIEYEEGWYQ